MTDYGAYDQNLPCKNPSCKSHGRPHPNCRCYAGLAKGGAVEHFCSEDRPHDKLCAYYAEGGDVVAPPQPAPQFREDSASTLGHAAVTQGLLGLLKNAGHPKMMDPKHHEKVLHEIRDQYAWRADPNEQELPKTLGRRLGNAIADNDHEKAASLIHGHPLVGGAGLGALKPIMERIGSELVAQPPSPEGMRSAADYLSSSMRGNSTLDQHFGKLFGNEDIDQEPNEDQRTALKSHLEGYDEDPMTALETGGALGHYLPVHGAQIGALAGRAMNYFKGLRPAGVQSAPLDSVTTPSRHEEQKYERQLDIAQNPLLVLKHTQKGSLQAKDVQTLSTLYPGLHQAMIQKATEKLIEKGDSAKELPFAQQQALSLLMGQPLNSNFKPQVMQSIIQSQGAQQAQQQAKQPKKASGVELDQIDKTDALSATPEQARQINKHQD